MRAAQALCTPCHGATWLDGADADCTATLHRPASVVAGKAPYPEATACDLNLKAVLAVVGVVVEVVVLLQTTDACSIQPCESQQGCPLTWGPRTQHPPQCHVKWSITAARASSLQDAAEAGKLCCPDASRCHTAPRRPLCMHPVPVITCVLSSSSGQTCVLIAGLWHTHLCRSPTVCVLERALSGWIGA